MFLALLTEKEKEQVGLQLNNTAERGIVWLFIVTIKITDFLVSGICSKSELLFKDI